MSLRLSKTTSFAMSTAELLSEDDGCDEHEKRAKGWFMSLFGAFTTHPSDWHIFFNERLETIDWDSKCETVAQPLGNFLTLTFYTVRLLQNNLIRPNLHKINEKLDNFDLSKSEILRKYDYLSQCTSEQGQSVGSLYYRFLGRLSKFLELMVAFLLLTNIFVTYKYFWGDFKTYSLFYVKRIPHSKNVEKSSLKKLGQHEDEQSLWSLLCCFFSGIQNKDQEALMDDNDDDYYYKLSKWTPSKFMTTLFVSFAPTCIVFLLLTEVSFFTAFAVLCHQCVLHFIVINRYGNRIEHESVIASATSSEWESKFVRPKMSRKVQDVAIDSTPYGDGMIKFYSTLTANRSRIFQTHSLSGDTITEAFNPRTREFEDLKDGSATHNVVRTAHPAAHYMYKDPYEHQRSIPLNEPGRPSFPSREPSPNRLDLTRVIPKVGFCSPLGSSISGMSTPLMRPERVAYLNPAYAKSSLSGREDYFTNDYPRRNSRSPLRDSPNKSMVYSPDWFKDHGSSRSTSKSPTPKKSV